MIPHGAIAADDEVTVPFAAMLMRLPVGVTCVSVPRLSTPLTVKKKSLRDWAAVVGLASRLVSITVMNPFVVVTVAVVSSTFPPVDVPIPVKVMDEPWAATAKVVAIARIAKFLFML